jgi:predicted ATPase
MKESIIIRNFGAIKEIEIDDIRPMTVFIGKSGSGKSTILKTIVLFRWIYKMINVRSFLKHANITQSPFTFKFKEYLKNNGLINYLKNNTEIIYKRGNNIISYNGSLDSSITISEEELSLEKMSFIADKRILIPDILASKKKKEKLPMSFFLEETYNDFNIASEYIKELNIDYLEVKYFSKERNSVTEHFIEVNNEEIPINLEDSSSGTQTVIPLSLIVGYFSKYYDFNSKFNKMIFRYMSDNDSLKDFRSNINIGDIPYKNIHIHIEEPELSLDPESQRELLNFLINKCFIDKSEDYKLSLMLATHSPYIVNHLNLLIMAARKEKPIGNALIQFDNIDVFEITDGFLNDLKRDEKFIIDTRSLSNPISDIYDNFNQLNS